MLKILKMQKEREQLEEQLEAKYEARQAFELKAEELRQAIEEDHNLDQLEEEITEFEKDSDVLEDEIMAIEEEIRSLDEGIAGLSRGIKKEEETINMNLLERRVTNVYERRERMAEALKQNEVREFFCGVAERMQTRAVDNYQLLIPETLINMIAVDMLDVGKVYALVTRQSVGGTSRIALAGKTPTAIWSEMKAAIQELSLDFEELELDGYMISGYIPVYNYVIEDSFINLSDHIMQQLTKAIAQALDIAIVNGTGATGKQPEGIIPNMTAANKVSSDGTFEDLITHYALLPDDTGALDAIMTRATFYTWFASQMIIPTADGRILGQNAMTAQRLPDGTPVHFVPNTVINDNEVLIGDFKKYFLVQRASMNLAVSTEAKFVENQTVFRGTARYDGKLLDGDYWIHITLEP